MKSTTDKTNVFVFNNENEMRNMPVRVKNSIDPQYRCNICNKKYSSLSTLKTHKIRHKEEAERPYKCTFCSYKAASKRDLLRHHETHLGHARELYKCNYCEKLFKVKEYVAEHIRNHHTKEILYKCGQCSFSCHSRSALRTHLRYYHLKTVQIICPICNANFKTDWNLKIHLRSHAGARPFTCDQCDKSFIVKNRLTRHIQATHTPKAFECKTCQKKFSTVHLLKRHSLIHSGEKPFKCCFCPHKTNTQGNLVKHVRRIHRLHYFTYKDILLKQEQVDDPWEGLSKEEIQSMIDRGKETVESHLQILQEKGLTEYSYQDLEKVESLKKKIKEEYGRISLRKKTRSKKSKSQKTVNNKLEFEQKKNLPSNKFRNGNGNDVRKPHNQISLPSSDLSLPQMDDVLHTDNDITVVDGMSTSNTPTIHVLWNLNYTQSDDSKTLSSRTKKKSNAKKNNFKTKSASTRKKKSLKSKNHSDSDKNLLCRTESNLHSSNLLEDNELEFHDKPLMQLHETENFSSSNCRNELSTPLDNLATDLVTFDEIDSPNAIVVTPVVNAYIDKVYENVELCDQFLHINEEEPHLICTFETVSSPQEENRNINKLKVNSSSSYDLINEHKNKLNSTELSQTNLSDGELSNFQGTEVEYSDNSNSEIAQEINEWFEVANSMSSNKENISVIDNDEASNLMITIHNLSNFDTIKTEVESTNQETEEIILLQENEHGEALSPLFLVNEVSSVQPLKEIVIKNSSTDVKLDNDYMMVTSIAEVEENESEVVLVIP